MLHLHNSQSWQVFFQFIFLCLMIVFVYRDLCFWIFLWSSLRRVQSILPNNLLGLLSFAPNLVYYYYYYYLRIWVVHISVRRWSFTGVTVSLPGSSEFWPISIMLSFECCLHSPPTSKSSSPWNNPLVTVQKAPIKMGIIVTFMFHSFFQFSCKVQVLMLLFTFFQFYSLVSRDSKVNNFANSLFVVDYNKVWSSSRDYYYFSYSLRFFRIS